MEAASVAAWRGGKVRFVAIDPHRARSERGLTHAFARLLARALAARSGANR
jgi:hypothetical protein